MSSFRRSISRKYKSMINTPKTYAINTVADLENFTLINLAKMDPSDINPDLTAFEVVDLKSFVLKKLLNIRESLGPKGGKDDDGRKTRLADFRVNLTKDIIIYNTYHTPTTKRSASKSSASKSSASKSSASKRGGRKSRRPHKKQNHRSTSRG